MAGGVRGVLLIITPYMLVTVIGAIASGRVPVGNAAGDLGHQLGESPSILSVCLAVVTGRSWRPCISRDSRRMNEAPLARRNSGAGP